jgi:hypothetical protein
MRAPFLLHAMFFCKIVARWVYLYTRMTWHGDALLSVECFSFVKGLQDVTNLAVASRVLLASES